MILITGATGHLGKATAEFLSGKTGASNIAAMARDTEKLKDLAGKGIALRSGDYDDYNSLLKAMEGVDTLLFISSSSPDNDGRIQQHRNVINAAKAQQVKHIVYTSMLKTSPASAFIPTVSHYQTELYLKESGLHYTIFRNTFYTEVALQLLGDALQSGNWYFAGGEAKAAYADRKDIAEALANVIAEPSAHLDKVYEIVGDKAVSCAEIADMISELSGKPVTYHAVPATVLKEEMKKSGLPELVVDLMVSGAVAISNGELDVADPALEKILGRKPVSLKESLQGLLAG